MEGREVTLALRATIPQVETSKDLNTLKVISEVIEGLSLMGAVEALGQPRGVHGKGLRTNR